MNETAIAPYEEAPRSAMEIKAQVNLIQEVMKSVMKNDVHFGTIPGCGPKPTLLKAGAEKLMSTFRLAADPIIDDLSLDDEARYRITVRMMTPSGVFVGAGIGEASSSEEKYKWRKSVCKEEWIETPEDRRRNKWVAPHGKDPFKIQQVRSNVSDIANTVLKMAKKRAMIDGVLTVTAASDLFTQDIEDMSKEALNQNNGGQSQTTSQQRKSENKSEVCACGKKKAISFPVCYDCNNLKKSGKSYGGQLKEEADQVKRPDPNSIISPEKKKMLEGLIGKSALSRDDLKDFLDVKSFNDIENRQMDDALKMISDNPMQEPGSQG